jgi:hypothetical protein
MIRKSGTRFSEKIMLEQRAEHDPEKWTRFSEKIMLEQRDETMIRWIGSWLSR